MKVLSLTRITHHNKRPLESITGQNCHSQLAMQVAMTAPHYCHQESARKGNASPVRYVSPGSLLGILMSPSHDSAKSGCMISRRAA